MQSKTHFPLFARLNFQRRMWLTHALIPLVAVFIAERSAGVLFEPQVAAQWGVRAALAMGSAALIGLLAGIWSGRVITSRLNRAIEISRAWLRGDLSLRIEDPAADELGLLAEQLDMLAAHLERDEQDLVELRERNTRLTDQVRALAVVEERNRLARELHDSVKQHLFSLALTASAIRTHLEALQRARPGAALSDVAPGDMVEMAREIEAAAQAAQRETTRLIEDLRPSSVQEQGLAAALNDYVLLLGAREHLLIYFDVKGNDKLLPSSIAETFYRVAQEALHNVVRHARATRADVLLQCLPAQVTLTIRDNGVGFDTTKPRRGLGLANMEERLLEINGRLTIESQPGFGVTVTAEATLPYPLPDPLSAVTELAREEVKRLTPTPERWAWLGQKLTIPVGQKWPWLPADQAHLRRPLVEAGRAPVAIKPETGPLGLRRNYLLYVKRQDHRRLSLVRVRRRGGTYRWHSDGVTWMLFAVRGSGGGMVLTRNGQPLAAMQYQGRLLNTWTEIVYDGRGYGLSIENGRRILSDEAGNAVLTIHAATLRIEIHSSVPLPLLVMVAMRAVDETVSTATRLEEA